MPRPNILYLHSHDTGRYIQPYGHAIPTPNLQRLAEEGVLFRQAFTAAPTCSPSRACLLTGQSAHNSGMVGLAHRGFRLNDYRQHLVHTLHAAGYTSTLIGVQHVAKDPAEIGYKQVIPGSRAPQAAAHAQAFFDSKPAEPFFLDIGVFETHRKYRPAGRAEDARYCLPPSHLPDTPETRADMADFKASARVLDLAYGSILDSLDACGLAENTLVICTTDHGIAFPRMKCNLTDAGTGVLLIMRGPGGFTGGLVCDAMVSHLDIFPTLCDLLEIERPPWLQGESLLPLVRGEAEEIHEEIFTEVNYHAAFEPMRGVRTKRWKYIRRYDGRTTPVLPNCDDGPTKSVWMAGGWRERPVEEEQLYDLLFDPQEVHNLAGDPAYADTLAEMRGRLDRWMRATDDPLLTGNIPVPPGARVNDPDGISPTEPPRAMA